MYFENFCLIYVCFLFAFCLDQNSRIFFDKRNDSDDDDDDNGDNEDEDESG